VYDCMILRKTVSTKLACLFHVIVNISFSYDLFKRKQQTFKNQMLESHHLISSVISPVTNLARATDRGCNCRLSILDCRIVNYFSKTALTFLFCELSVTTTDSWQKNQWKVCCCSK